MLPIKSIQNRLGLTRLMLIHSAGFEKAVIPLDRPLYLSANNNIGKTSLVRALQFFFIADYGKMNFDNRDNDKSRKHYFPSESSYILCEAKVNTGKVVLVAAGQGKLYGNQHFYFAYQGELKEDDYIIEGKRIPSTEILSHLLTRGYTPYKLKPRELTRALLGGTIDKEMPLNLAIYPLLRQADEDIFKELFKNILDLLNLKASDIKKLLLQVFRHDLKAEELDFKKTWDDAFGDVNNQERLYEILLENSQELARFTSNLNDLMILNGKIRTMTPVIKQALKDWSGFFREKLKDLRKQDDRISRALRDCKNRKQRVEKKRFKLERKHEHILQWFEQYKILYDKYGDKTLDLLKAEAARLSAEYDSVIAQTHGISEDGIVSLKKNEKRLVEEIERFETLLSTRTDTLLNRTSRILPRQKMEVISKVINPEVWNMPCVEPYIRIEGAKYKSTLQNIGKSVIDNESIQLEGITINLTNIKVHPSLSTMNSVQRKAELTRMKSELGDIQKQLKLLGNRAKAQRLKDKLEKKWDAAKESIKEFKDYSGRFRIREKKKKEQKQVEDRIQAIESKIMALETSKEQYERELDVLAKNKIELEKQNSALKDLVSSHEFITIDSLEDYPFLPFSFESKIELANLDVEVEKHFQDLNKFGQVTSALSQAYKMFVKEGYYLYEGLAKESERWEAIVARYQNLDRESEIITKSKHSAIAIVGSALETLSSDYYRLKRQVENLNGNFSQYRISDLQQFKILIEPLGETLHHIETLVDAGRTASAGDTLNLYRRTNIPKHEINSAYESLISLMTIEGPLKLQQLFSIAFKVVEKDGVEKIIENFQDSGSNGTRATVKLLTGMQLIHHLVAKQKKNLYRLPYYLDEASNLDIHNQRTVIETAEQYGFASIFASVDIRPTCNVIVKIFPGKHKLFIDEKDWIHIEPEAN